MSAPEFTIKTTSPTVAVTAVALAAHGTKVWGVPSEGASIPASTPVPVNVIVVVLVLVVVNVCVLTEVVVVVALVVLVLLEV
jgi:hypothetical protein